MHAYRTHTCGALRSETVGETVRLSGWVHRKRDHGGLLFIDLRDHYGLTQLVVEPEAPFFAEVERVRQESVIRVTGRVVARDEEVKNPNLDTGDIEVRIDAFEVMSAADDLEGLAEMGHELAEIGHDPAEEAVVAAAAVLEALPR